MQTGVGWLVVGCRWLVVGGWLAGGCVLGFVVGGGWLLVVFGFGSGGGGGQRAASSHQPPHQNHQHPPTHPENMEACLGFFKFQPGPPGLGGVAAWLAVAPVWAVVRGGPGWKKKLRPGGGLEFGHASQAPPRQRGHLRTQNPKNKKTKKNTSPHKQQKNKMQ